MGFLGIYTAVYDYEPQGEGELAISDGDILYVLEKSGEDDWWKAKKKASGEDEDEPVGLIPNNYVEEAHPIHQARALYDYTRQTDEELSFSEDAQLEVFDISDPDWILVGLDAEYGFVPANYIEISEREASSAPVPPSLPRRPVQEQEDEEPEPSESPIQSPAAALAGIMNRGNAPVPAARPNAPQLTPEASDEEEPPTPTLPARPKSQEVSTEPVTQYASARPISPGIVASPPYNRVRHSRGIDDEMARSSPGGFHMYNVNEMVTVMGKKKKMPTTLGVNIATGMIMIAPEKSRDGPEQSWTAEKMMHYSLEGKHVFLELVRPSKSVDFHAGAKDTAEEIVSALGELAGAIRAEGLRDILLAGAGPGQKKGQVLYDFMAQGDDEVTVAVGDEVIIVDDSKSEEWWQVRRIKNGAEGVVPSSYIEITGTLSVPGTPGINSGKSIVEQNRLEEERLAREALKTARREEDSKAEVGPGMKLPERGSSLSARSNGNSALQQRSRRENGRSANGSSHPKTKPDPSKVRTWNDRSKSFSVEAQFLALKDGKINLHKMNGVKIAVPVSKMSVEDLEYVERIAGVSLDEDKPLSDVKKQRSRASAANSGAGASIERQQKPEYDWFQFFLSCDVAVGLCERYAQTFTRDSMDESVLPDVDSTVLRTLGLREGDIIKVMRFLDKKYGRTSAKRNVSFGGEEVISQNTDSSGSLFSGPGGTLRNNTRKGRPAPAVQTNDVVDPKAFSQDSREDSARSPRELVATPLTSAPTPVKKDPVRRGFDDDAWDVKPSQQPQSKTSQPSSSTPAPSHPPPSSQPNVTGAMGDLSLLAPLEPIKLQHTAPAPQAPQPQASQSPQQPQSQPQGATPAFFAGIGNQQTGLPPQQTGYQQQQTPSLPMQGNTAPNNQFMPQNNFQQQNIARARPAPPPPMNQSSLMPALPPSRPLSAPQTASAFNAPPPLQAQNTGYSSVQQSQVAPPGQSLNEINQQRQQQHMFQQQQNFQNAQPMGVMLQPTGFNQFQNGQQFRPGQPNGFQQLPMQTGSMQQQFGNHTGGSPFADPRTQQFSPPTIQPQPTGFQSSFPSQQFPQQTGVNSFLPPALQPQPTGMNGVNNSFNQGFNPPPIPPMPQQQTPAPLMPQKTGPPPPVRFGLNGDTKKLMPQATGRRANLSQATPQNPFGF